LLLPIAQLAHNNKLLELIEKILFFANYRRHLYLFKRTLPSANAKAALVIVEELKEIYKIMQERIKKA
jgi:DNA-binding GntR family transcriptional regulator